MIYMRNCLLFISVLLFLASAEGQVQPSASIFERTDVRPGFIAATRQYSDSSLWGFMNGGADLYQEYGIIQLTHQEIVFRDALFKADIYEMKDKAAAVGIYSVSVFKCQSCDSIYTYMCINPYQVQFANGRYYVSVTNNRGDSLTSAAAVTLAHRLLRKNLADPFTPPALFQARLLSGYQQYVKVIYGPLGLQNGYPDWSDRFENMQGYYITLLPLSDSGGSVGFARIMFGSPEDLDVFRKRINLTEPLNAAYWKYTTKDKVLVLIKLDETNCVFVETRGNHPLAADLLESMHLVGQKVGEALTEPQR